VHTRPPIGSRGLILSVAGPKELKDARRIDGIDPHLTFAIQHDSLTGDCPDESVVDWLPAYRVNLSRERVKSITRLVEEA
jgi:hypothetical protein